MNTMKGAVLLLVLFISSSNVQGAKILGIFPVAAPSHYILGNSLMRGLAERGHDVTIISPFVEKNPPKNGTYKDIVLTGFVEEHKSLVKKMNMFDMENKNFLFLAPFIIKIMLDSTEKVLSHPNVQNFINSDETFDVVIVEQFMNEAHKAFATHFNAPLILLSTIGASSWVNFLVGNPAPTSYVPDALLSYSSHMTFYERTMNSLMFVFNYCLTHLYIFRQQNLLIKKYFPNGPQIDDIVYNASIVLLNSHPSTNQPVPYVPNMIDIGGFHVKSPQKLPKDLQEYLDNAKEGVIYFSLGSNLQSSQLPPEKRDAFLKTFGKLKQKVVWKWEEDVLPGQPANVKLGKWFPQQDILAHPNVKVFITHGGLLSTLETIYHGVPVLAIPIGADQKLNAQHSANQGFGLMLGYKEVSEATLTDRLKELLSNSKYAKNAKDRSKFFHDRLVSPMETATYWVEYVIRHRGAPHLRVAALDLPLYKYFLLDVMGFLAIVSVFGMFIFYFISKKLICLLCKKRKEKVKKH